MHVKDHKGIIQYFQGPHMQGKGFCYNNSYKHKEKIFLVVLHLPFIIGRHCGPLVLQYFKLYRPLHQYGLYKSTDNISPMLKTLISSSVVKIVKGNSPIVKDIPSSMVMSLSLATNKEKTSSVVNNKKGLLASWACFNIFVSLNKNNPNMSITEAHSGKSKKQSGDPAMIKIQFQPKEICE